MLLCDAERDSHRRVWLAKWLAAHSPREPGAEASYIYLGLVSDWSMVDPDGMGSSGGVTGFGSGIGFREPPGASPALVSEIVRRAIAELLDGSAVRGSAAGPVGVLTEDRVPVRRVSGGAGLVVDRLPQRGRDTRVGRANPPQVPRPKEGHGVLRLGLPRPTSRMPS